MTTYIDLETRSVADVTEVGAYNLSLDPTLMLASIHWAFDDGDVQHWRGLFNPNPTPPFELWDRIKAGDELVCWNAAFERHIWNAVAKRTPTMPQLQVKQLFCAATLARAHNLPSGLKEASRWLPEHQRKLDNKNYHRIWRIDEADPLTERDRPLYDSMVTYGDHDIVSMRALVKLMVGWDVSLLTDYRISEAINDRGVGIDREWCRRAVALKDILEAEASEYLWHATCEPCGACEGSGREEGARPGKTRRCQSCDGEGMVGVKTAKQSAKLREWVQGTLEAHGISTEPEQFQTTKKKVNATGTGYFSEVRNSFDSNTRRKLIEWMDEREVDCDPVRDVIEAVEEASGAASSKYQAALDRSDDRGIMRGMYILNGAAQTGRFSAAGMQTHNMIRKVLPKASDAIELLMRTPDEDVKRICRESWNLRVNEVLGRLLRPTLVPRQPGNVLCWADWSAIEARVCPWLSLRPSASKVLGLFASGADVYLKAAEDIVGREVKKEDPERQYGKVAVLALGFGGGVNAYTSMAKNYGIAKMPGDAVREIVKAWRDANPWAQEWWAQLEMAAMNAMRYPAQEFTAGRVTFAYLPALLEGALVMWLPDGRPLFYPAAEIRPGKRFEDDEHEVDKITYVHASYGRIPIWYGQLAENATQGTAASLLRLALRRIERSVWLGELVGHTHDEIIAECREGAVDMVAEHLHRSMTDVPKWAEGLPLAAEVKAGWAYYEPEITFEAD